MFCSECGKEFKTEDKRVRLCPDCKEEKKNKTRTCVICGVKLSGNARKYCTQCSKDVKLKQIQRAMDKKHHIAINKSVYDDFKKYFKKPAKEIERLMLVAISRLEWFLTDNSHPVLTRKARMLLARGRRSATPG